METFVALAQVIPDSPQALLDFVTSLFLDHGYLVAFIGAAVDNFGMPASGDVVLFAGGWLASTDRAILALIMLFGGLGALVSDNAMYWIGRLGGRRLIDRLFRSRFIARLVDAKHISRVEHYFETHGGKTVFAGRFGPGLRSTTPLFAGMSRMKYYKFASYNLSAIVVWAIAYATIGYFFGQYWDQLLQAARSFGFGVVILIALILVTYLYYRRYRKSRI